MWSLQYLDVIDIEEIGVRRNVDANGEGSNSRVQLSFSNPTTGEKAQIRVENGKTVIS